MAVWPILQANTFIWQEIPRAVHNRFVSLYIDTPITPKALQWTIMLIKIPFPSYVISYLIIMPGVPGSHKFVQNYPILWTLVVLVQLVTDFG